MTGRRTTFRVVPGNFIGFKLLREVRLAEELHADDSEDVDDDAEDEGEVTEGAECLQDDAQ